MRLVTFVILALAVTAVSNGEAAGCARGTVMGGVAGHVAGKHGVAGAPAGCAIGHHEAVKKAKAASHAEAASQPSPR
jgi:hypothetical protein